MNIGIYLCTCNNPMFLRMALLQIYAQTMLPDVVVIHENGHKKSYKNLVADVAETLKSYGVQLVWLHTPRFLSCCEWYSIALGEVLKHNCDAIFKFDQDDFYYTNHIERVVHNLDGYEMTVNTQCHMVALKQVGEYDQYGMHLSLNPTGGMSDSVAFTKKFGAMYHRMMVNSRQYDDEVMAQCMALFGADRINKVSQEPTTAFIMHTSNNSTTWDRSDHIRGERETTELG